MRFQISLKTFNLVVIIAVALLIFISVYFITATTYRQLLIHQANSFTLGVGEQISRSLLQLMQKGWSRKELFTFLDPVIHANKQIPTGVSIYRASSVVDLYGAIDAVMHQEQIRTALETGEDSSLHSDNVITRIIAVKAVSSCLECHHNVQEGDVLGVLEITQDFSSSIDAVNRNFIFVFPALFLFAIFLTTLASRWASGKIETATTKLHDTIKGVNSISDLTLLKQTEHSTDFSELNRIIGEFNRFAEKIKQIAIDKDLLTFEVTLLETFILTSEVVKDWRDHVAKLLNQVNTIMDAYLLFSVFYVGEENYDLEVFWKNKPSEKTKRFFDKVVSERLDEHKHLRPFINISIKHNIVNHDSMEIELDAKDIALQTKSIFLEKPQIGGVVGIGVHSKFPGDENRALVIESILTTLINVVGSVKAIYNYTKELEYYVTRDPLTNLYNQRFFWDYAENELKRAESQKYPVGIVLIDLDNFKIINDRYGHVFGDSFLQNFAALLQRSLTPGNVLTRYGGDEFALILPESDPNDTYTTAVKLIERIKEFTIQPPDGKTLNATVSIGFANFPEHTNELKNMFIIANNMMYQAKSEGKNRIGVPTRENIIQVMRTSEEKTLFLLHVLEQKDKIIPFFQPIMNLQSNEYEMHELLMAIEHDGKMLSASQFIEDAENLGVVSQLDYIVIEKAFQHVRDKDYQGMLFINLSPKSLILNQFIGNVRQMAKSYSITPEKIVFEITERETVKNRDLLNKFVTELKTEGFKFAIDDFGAGFSTFHYIKLFPVDFIKIEGEFIRNAPTDKTYKAFVRSIVSLAKELEIKTIAEMIEDEEILETIRDIGADYGQGYHIQRPMQEIQ